MNNLTKNNTTTLQEVDEFVRQYMAETFKNILNIPCFPHHQFMKRDLLHRVNSNLPALLTRMGVYVVETILKLEEEPHGNDIINDTYDSSLRLSEWFDNILADSAEVEGGLYEIIENWLDHQLYSVARGYVEVPPEWFQGLSTFESLLHEESQLANVKPFQLNFSEPRNLFAVLKVYDLRHVQDALCTHLVLTSWKLPLSQVWQIGCNALGLPNMI